MFLYTKNTASKEGVQTFTRDCARDWLCSDSYVFGFLRLLASSRSLPSLVTSTFKKTLSTFYSVQLQDFPTVPESRSRKPTKLRKQSLLAHLFIKENDEAFHLRAELMIIRCECAPCFNERIET